MKACCEKPGGLLIHHINLQRIFLINILLFYFSKRIKLNIKQSLFGISLLQLLIQSSIWGAFTSSLKEAEVSFVSWTCIVVTV